MVCQKRYLQRPLKVFQESDVFTLFRVFNTVAEISTCPDGAMVRAVCDREELEKICKEFSSALGGYTVAEGCY